MHNYRLLAVTRCVLLPAGIATACLALLIAGPGQLHNPLVIATFSALAGMAIVEGLFHVRHHGAKDRRAESAVRESEARFRHISNAAPVMMWMTDPDQCVSFVSEPWQQFTGISEREVIERQIESLKLAIHPEDLADSLYHFYRSSQKRVPFAVEYRLRRHDGEYRWVHDAGVPRFTSDGEYAGYVGVACDIDDRKRAEAALQANEQRLRMLVENVPLTQYVTDKDGILLLVEGRALEQLGVRQDDLVGRSAFEVFAGDDAITGRVRRALGGETVTGVVSFSDMWWEVYYTPICDRDGKVAGITVVGLDVSEREEAKAALEESELRYRLIARATIDAVWDWDLKTGYVWRSEGFSTLFGYPVEAIGNDPMWWADRVHPDDAKRVIAAGNAFVASGDVDVTMEYRYRRADGTYARVVSRVYAVRDEKGNATRVIGSMTDITEQRQLEEQFLQAQKMETVGRLAGGIAHDFSNLMTAIMVNAELDLLSLPSGETLRADLEEIKATAERAANLSKQLLSFARRQIVEPQVIALNDLLRRSERMLQRLIGANIVFGVECTSDCTNVRIDPGQLEQVLVNVVVNARDAMPNGGRLTIRSARVGSIEPAVRENGAMPPGDYVMLQVSDTGIGMAEDVRQHVFEPFFTTKGFGGGTGLGLPTSHGIVKQAGGDITVESEIGRGATFRIYLPVVSAEVTQQLHPATSIELPGGDETILLVEDEPAVRRSASRALRQLGYKVLEAADGREGLATGRAHGEAISLVVTDVVMPWVGGKELAQALREVRPDMRVLFLSGYTNDESMRTGISEHAIDFIAKPFSPSALARKVREVLDRAPDEREIMPAR